MEGCKKSSLLQERRLCSWSEGNVHLLFVEAYREELDDLDLFSLLFWKLIVR